MNATQAQRAIATRRRSRWTLRAAPLVVMVLATGILAGCGSSGSSSVAAQGGSSSKQHDSAQLVRYAQCMRAHGVTNFPDPTSSGALTLTKSTVESPQFHSASQACRSLAPAGSQNGSGSPQMQAQALRFAQCMRAHGVTNFPDPSTSGPDGPIGFGLSQSVHDSPAMSSAVHACRSLFAGGAHSAGYGS